MFYDRKNNKHWCVFYFKYNAKSKNYQKLAVLYIFGKPTHLSVGLRLILTQKITNSANFPEIEKLSPFSDYFVLRPIFLSSDK